MPKNHSPEIVEELERRLAEKARIEENERVIDDRLEYLARVAGRELTEEEQCGVLDIVDEYTPKDENGNYTGPVIPFLTAWKIYLELELAKLQD